MINGFEYTGIPTFYLNAVRRKFRKKFISLVKSGDVDFEDFSSCLCGSLDLSVIAEQDRFGLPFYTMVCNDCGLLLTHPRLSGSSIVLYYNTVYFPLAVGLESDKISTDTSLVDEQGREIFDFIEGHLTDLNHINIIEIGCASGKNLLSIRSIINEKLNKNCSIYGVEYEKKYALHAEKQGVTILEDLSISSIDKQFDIVILSHVMEHLVDVGQTLLTISRSMTRNGVLYIEVPGVMNHSMIKKDYLGDFVDYLIHAHLYNFNSISLTNILKKHGFQVVEENENVQVVCKILNDNESTDKLDVVRNNASDIMKHLFDTYSNHKKMMDDRKVRNFIKRLYHFIRMIYYRLPTNRLKRSDFKY